MFVVQIMYLEPINRIMELRNDHLQFLEKYYKLGKFIVSGPQVPYKGGIIIAVAEELKELKEILSEDPFWRENAAHYEIIEFTPTMHISQLSQMLP